MGNQLIKEQIIEILESDYCDGGPTLGSIADKIENLVNQEVERRIKERMPSEEESKKEADELFEGTNREFRKGMYSGFLFGIQWLRSRLTNPGEQKTEGGGE